MNTITEKQGFEAMILTLKIYWDYTGSDSLLTVLSGGQYASDGFPVNSDLYYMWQDAVEKIKNGAPPLSISLEKK